jgi:putative lipoprotein
LNGDVEPAAPSNKVITGFDANIHTLLPIPLTEIQLNKDGDLKQNPGY